MTWILALKTLHIALAITSISFFLVRFLGRQANARFLGARILRVMPHVIDTLLLASGVALAVVYRLSPLDAHWLLIKLILVACYIAAGFGAMKATVKRRRTGYAVLAVCLISGAIIMAMTKPV